MSSTLTAVYSYDGRNIQPTGVWRYAADIDYMEIEVTYSHPIVTTRARFTRWLSEDQVTFFCEVRPDED